MPVIDQELRSFTQSCAAISVATRSAELVPHAVRGWGARVSPDCTSLEVFVDRPAAADIVDDLHDNGRVAVCFVDVVSLRAVQLKGRCVEVGDPRAEDWPWIDKHREAFTAAVAQVGFPPETTRNLWSTQVVRLRFVVDDLFNQTPGPLAGRPL